MHVQDGKCDAASSALPQDRRAAVDRLAGVALNVIHQSFLLSSSGW